MWPWWISICKSTENQVSTGAQEKEFVESLRDGFLEKFMVESTQGKAILDLLVCKEPGLIKELRVNEVFII